MSRLIWTNSRLHPESLGLARRGTGDRQRQEGLTSGTGRGDWAARVCERVALAGHCRPSEAGGSPQVPATRCPGPCVCGPWAPRLLGGPGMASVWQGGCCPTRPGHRPRRAQVSRLALGRVRLCACVTACVSRSTRERPHPRRDVPQPPGRHAAPLHSHWGARCPFCRGHAPPAVVQSRPAVLKGPRAPHHDQPWPPSKEQPQRAREAPPTPLHLPRGTVGCGGEDSWASEGLPGGAVRRSKVGFSDKCGRGKGTCWE